MMIMLLMSIPVALAVVELAGIVEIAFVVAAAVVVETVAVAKLVVEGEQRIVVRLDSTRNSIPTKSCLYY